MTAPAREIRTEVLESRPVNLDGFVEEWPEKGLVAMESDFDPAPSIRVEDGRVVELDGKARADFDFMDTFIANHAIDVASAEASNAIPSARGRPMRPSVVTLQVGRPSRSRSSVPTASESPIMARRGAGADPAAGAARTQGGSRTG